MKLYKIVLTLLIALLIVPNTNAKKQTFDELCMEILESLQAFYPVNSTQMGIHSYDHRFTDYTDNSVKTMIKKLTDYEKKLYKYKSANLSKEQRINYKLVKSNVDIALLDLKQIKWHKKSPQLYVDEAVNGLYSLVLSNHAPESEKVVTIIRRMKAVPQLFATARRNITNPPEIYTKVALENLESGIKFYQEVAGDLMSKFPERADEILKESTKAREAMNDFSIFLSELNSTKPTSFAIGTKNYEYKLKNEYFLDITADSLLKLGEAYFDEADQNYREYKKYVVEHHQNGSDSIFVPANFTKQDILDYYNWEADQVALYVKEHNLVTIPDNIAPMTVIETPPFLRTMVAGIAYHPAGPFDTNQHGYFYVRPIPDDLSHRQLEARYRYVHRRGFKGSVVHEAYPGHHLQMQISSMNPDPVRKWQQNLMLIEGWALYSEQMMYEQGLFGEEDNTHWLAVLGGIRFRAARIIADVKLHTGQFTYDDCVAWMTKALEIESESGKEYIEKQVAKYTLAPTMPMTYLMGKKEILSLLDAYKVKQGDNFTLQGFHDNLLKEGSIPPALLWDTMDLTN